MLDNNPEPEARKGQAQKSKEIRLVSDLFGQLKVPSELRLQTLGGFAARRTKVRADGPVEKQEK
jgi:hypothetical protein